MIKEKLKLVSVFLLVLLNISCVAPNNKYQQPEPDRIETYVSHLNRVKFNYDRSVNKLDVISLEENDFDKAVINYTQLLKDQYKKEPIVTKLNNTEISSLSIISVEKGREKIIVGKYPKPYIYELTKPEVSIFVIRATVDDMDMNIKNSITFRFNDKDYLIGLSNLFAEKSIFNISRDYYPAFHTIFMDEYKNTRNVYKSIEKGLIHSEDNSSFWTKDKINSLVKGKIKTIGIDFIDYTINSYIIFNVYPNTPADRAGIKIGDIIESINRNNDGSVSLKLLRLKENKRFELTLLPEEYSFDRESKINLIKDKYLYIEMSGCFNVDACKNYTDNFYNKIKDFNMNNIEGVLIDLRRTAGGNIWPMFNSLGPILGEGVFGGRVNNKLETFLWSYSNGKVLSGNNIMDQTSRNPYQFSNNIPVRVLISNSTSDSGEAIAAAFKDRINTKLIGNITNGKSMGNTTFILWDDSWINISDTVNLNRNEKVEYVRDKPVYFYKNSRSNELNNLDAQYIVNDYSIFRVLPDISINTNNEGLYYFQDFEKDPVINYAIESINSK